MENTLGGKKKRKENTLCVVGEGGGVAGRGRWDGAELEALQEGLVTVTVLPWLGIPGVLGLCFCGLPTRPTGALSPALHDVSPGTWERWDGARRSFRGGLLGASVENKLQDLKSLRSPGSDLL